MKTILAIRLWFLNRHIAMGEAQMQRLVDELPKAREERAQLAQRLYAMEQEQPA